MQGIKLTVALALAILTYTTSAAPIPQLAGVGDACYSIFNEADNGIGYGSESALENGASLAKSTSSKGTVPKIMRRQGAGVGKGCDSIFTETDNGVGYGSEYALENGASLVKTTAAKKVTREQKKRQINKTGAGIGAVLNLAPGAQGTSKVTQNEINTLDDDGTSDSALVGAQVGKDEDTFLEQGGKAVPSSIGRRRRRQINKTGAGVGAVLDLVPGAQGTSKVTQNEINTLDDDGTSDSALVGAQVGKDEDTSLEQGGKAVPSSLG